MTDEKKKPTTGDGEKKPTTRPSQIVFDHKHIIGRAVPLPSTTPPKPKPKPKKKD